VLARDPSVVLWQSGGTWSDGAQMPSVIIGEGWEEWCKVPCGSLVMWMMRSEERDAREGGREGEREREREREREEGREEERKEFFWTCGEEIAWR
jgi:hypothetical protein